jgi:hypothetical protein
MTSTQDKYPVLLLQYTVDEQRFRIVNTLRKIMGEELTKTSLIRDTIVSLKEELQAEREQTNEKIRKLQEVIDILKAIVNSNVGNSD